jgi:ribosomal protein S18 acetylase RimI-like enzyme
VVELSSSADIIRHGPAVRAAVFLQRLIRVLRHRCSIEFEIPSIQRSVIITQLRADEAERLRAIRLRSLADAPDAFATTYAAASTWPLSQWAEQLAQFPTFVAQARATDVGLVRIALSPESEDIAHLISMWVAPEVRRQGVGSALVDAVVHWARAQALHRVVLDVAETNGPAMALYTRKGFTPTGVVTAFPPPRDHVREIQLRIDL